jgi:hypothetical protein
VKNAVIVVLALVVIGLILVLVWPLARAVAVIRDSSPLWRLKLRAPAYFPDKTALKSDNAAFQVSEAITV